MNLNPLRWLGRKSVTGGVISQSNREAAALGAWTGTLGGWVPRQCNPHLYENLREAIPIIDAGLRRLGAMDGLITIEGDNDALVAEIEDWAKHVPVNDLETGLQAFYASQGGEIYEQGFGVGEIVLGPRGRDVVGLRVADSKGVIFSRGAGGLRAFYRPPAPPSPVRPDGLDTVETLLRGGSRVTTETGLLSLGFAELDLKTIVVGLHEPEADNPYGTSVLRSLPFCAQILLRMENAVGRVWERFGDPIFHVVYKTKNRKLDAEALNQRATSILKNLAAALAAKARGNSVDFSTGVGADDEVSLDIVGADGQVLQIDAPVSHILQQVTSAFGLPPWMLGVQAQAVQGQSEQQAVLVLQDSQTRFARRSPGLERIVATMLRSRGRTWKPGDWSLGQKLPNLMDEARRAQAEFLRAQTAMMLGSAEAAANDGAGPVGIDNGLRSALLEYLSKCTAAGELLSPTPDLEAQFRRFGL